jgi:hypothetical protein
MARVHPRYTKENLDRMEKELYDTKTNKTSFYQTELEKARNEFKEGGGTLTHVIETEKMLEKYIPQQIRSLEEEIKAVKDARRTGKYPEVSDGWGGKLAGKGRGYKDDPTIGRGGETDVDIFGGDFDNISFSSPKKGANSGFTIGAYLIFPLTTLAALYGISEYPDGSVARYLPAAATFLSCLIGGPLIGAWAGKRKSRKQEAT